MSTENLTHWKKNNDSRYISGEDLQNGEVLNKGLRPFMSVVIERFEDSETYDQKQNEKVMKTGFYLKDLDSGKMLYKPVILNNTNAKFCIGEFKSEFMEHWLNKPLVLYAQQDRRHGYVARFRKYVPKKKNKTLNDDQFAKSLQAIKDETYTKESLLKDFELTKEQKAKL